MVDEPNRKLLYAYIDAVEMSVDHLVKAQTYADMLDDQFAKDIHLWSSCLRACGYFRATSGKCVVTLKLKYGNTVLKLKVDCSDAKSIYCDTCQFVVDADHMEQTIQKARPSLLDITPVLRALAVAKFQQHYEDEVCCNEPPATFIKRCKTE